MTENRERKDRYDPQMETLLSGCVWLILVTAGAAVFLTALFIGNWILS